MSEIITNVRRPRVSTSFSTVLVQTTQVYYYAVLLLKVPQSSASKYLMHFYTLSGKNKQQYIIKYQKNFSWENFKS